MLGSFKEVKDAEPELKEWSKKFKKQVEMRTNKEYDTFEAVKYTTQVVAGTNYKLKVHCGGDKYLHVKVHKPLPNSNEIEKVTEVEEDRKLEDEL